MMQVHVVGEIINLGEHNFEARYIIYQSIR
jgi:hypothetical protein